MKVDLSNCNAGEVPLMHLGYEVEGNYLLIIGVEAESRRQMEAIATAPPLRLVWVVSHSSLRT